MPKEFRQFIYTSFFPMLIIGLIWLVKAIEIYYRLDFSEYGIMPRSLEGLRGVLTSVIIHDDWEHVMANSLPLLVTLIIVRIFYKEILFPLIIQLWIYPGVWVWAFGAVNSVHIGASGLVYGLVSFLLFSGIIRRNKKLMAVSLLMIFLYGGFIWGVFPNFFPYKNISWESHLFGAVMGVVLAWFYRKTGMQKELYSWDMEEEEDETEMDYMQGMEEENKDSNLKN